VQEEEQSHARVLCSILVYAKFDEFFQQNRKNNQICARKKFKFQLFVKKSTSPKLFINYSIPLVHFVNSLSM
jgi:hypothetical protein